MPDFMLPVRHERYSLLTGRQPSEPLQGGCRRKCGGLFGAHVQFNVVMDSPIIELYATL
jgi:hypothetical protein